MKLKLLFLLMNVISISATHAPNEFATLHLKAHRIQEQDFNNVYLLVSRLKAEGIILDDIHIFDKAREIVHCRLNHWNVYGYGSYIFQDDSGNFIGHARLHPGHIDNKEEIILSYAVMLEYRNKGFATEMAQALVKIGFEQLGFKSIVCFTQPTNKASQRVIEKSGFTYEKTISEKEGPYKNMELIFYRLTKKGNS